MQTVTKIKGRPVTVTGKGCDIIACQCYWHSVVDVDHARCNHDN